MNYHNDGVIQAAIANERNPLTTVATATRRCKLLHNKKIRSKSGRRQLQQPKGNGIKDGFVRWLCVYAVVFWLLVWALCVGLPQLPC